MADKYYDLKIPFETLENSINQISDKIGYVEVSGNVLKFYDTKSTKKLLYSITLPSTINVIDSLESTSTTDALSANQGKQLYEEISMTPGTMSNNHSEIFNDYIANSVHNSSYSHAEGSRNNIGIPCFEIETIDTENKTIKLAYGTLGLKIGSVVHGILQNDSILLNIGTITSIDSENLMITIDEFLNQGPLADVQYIFIINKKSSYQNIYTGDNYIGGNFSHVEGYFSCAGGYYSHAEGFRTHALGFYSHTEGRNTLALGSSSHVEGQGTRADSSNQHVEGKNNIIDNEDKYVHIVGNGSAASNLSNAHTLDWDGNAWYQGTVECTGIILTSPNGTKYKVTITDSGTLTATEQSE